MAATSPSRVRKSAGVARQYCGRLGKVANCKGGMFLAYVSPLGRALVDKRLYLPKSWTSDQDRCAAAGVPEDRRSYRSKTELALELLERVLEWATSGPSGLPETTPSGCRRPSGRDWRPWGCARSLAGKPLAGFRATPSRRNPVLYGMVVYAIRFTHPLLYR